MHQFLWLLPLFPLLGSVYGPKSTTIHPTFPYGVTNPIWVDVGGDGFVPPGEPPEWAER